jgi:hypothetical protein
MVHGRKGLLHFTVLQCTTAWASCVRARKSKLFEHKNMAYASSLTAEHLNIVKLHSK